MPETPFAHGEHITISFSAPLVPLPNIKTEDRRSRKSRYQSHGLPIRVGLLFHPSPTHSNGPVLSTELAGEQFLERCIATGHAGHGPKEQRRIRTQRLNESGSAHWTSHLVLVRFACIKLDVCE